MPYGLPFDPSYLGKALQGVHTSSQEAFTDNDERGIFKRTWDWIVDKASWVAGKIRPAQLPISGDEIDGPGEYVLYSRNEFSDVEIARIRSMTRDGIRLQDGEKVEVLEVYNEDGEGAIRIFYAGGVASIAVAAIAVGIATLVGVFGIGYVVTRVEKITTKNPVAIVLVLSISLVFLGEGLRRLRM